MRARQAWVVAVACGAAACSDLAFHQLLAATAIPITVQVGGTLSGLTAGGTVRLSSNYGGDLDLAANGAFKMPDKVKQFSSYAITVGAQPATQLCSVVNGAGTVDVVDITNVAVSCGRGMFDVNVTIDGLLGGAMLTLTEGTQVWRLGNGAAPLGAARRAGAPLGINTSDPNAHFCDVPAWPASMPANDLNVVIHCRPLAYPVSFAATALPAGGAVDIAVAGAAAGAAHLTAQAPSGAWTQPVAYGSPVRAVATGQPSSIACRFANGTPIYEGVMPAQPLTLGLTCSQAFDLSGTVTGLAPGGQLTLALGGATATIGQADPTFRFARGLPAGAAWALTVLTQPANQRCSLTPASGPAAAAAVTGVAVACEPFLKLVTGQAAELAVGQPDLVSGTAGSAANRLDCPWNNPAIDANGALFVTAANSNTLLGFTPLPTGSNPSATFVVGAASPGAAGDGTFSYPSGVAASATTLAAIDYHGVWLWTPAPRGNRAPDVSMFTSSCSGAGLSIIQDVALVGPSMLVAQRAFHRVSIWKTLPTTGSQAADVVLGQANATTCGTGPVDATHTGEAEGVAANAQVTIVASGDGNRLLVWNQPPTSLTTGQAADLALGAANLVTVGSAAATATTYKPTKVLLSGSQMFVNDVANHRVLIWNQRPTSPSTPADVVLGQASATAYGCNRGAGPTATSLCIPHGLAVSQDSLWVNDHGNNRVLRFRGQ